MLFDGDIRYWSQIAAIALLFGSAWRWGAGPERALAGVLVWFHVADAINHAIFGWQIASGVDLGHLVIDGVALAVSLGTALFANRIYVLWFAAFQLISVLAHLARDVASGTATAAYLIMAIAPSYFQIILLACGIWMHRRRVLRYGPYRSWRISLSRSRVPNRPVSPNA